MINSNFKDIENDIKEIDDSFSDSLLAEYYTRKRYAFAALDRYIDNENYINQLVMDGIAQANARLAIKKQLMISIAITAILLAIFDGKFVLILIASYFTFLIYLAKKYMDSSLVDGLQFVAVEGRRSENAQIKINFAKFGIDEMDLIRSSTNALTPTDKIRIELLIAKGVSKYNRYY